MVQWIMIMTGISGVKELRTDWLRVIPILFLHAFKIKLIKGKNDA